MMTTQDTGLQKIKQLLIENRFYEFTVPLELQEQHGFDLVFVNKPVLPQLRLEDFAIEIAVEDFREASGILSLPFLQDLNPIQRYQLYMKKFHDAYKNTYSELAAIHGQTQRDYPFDKKREEGLQRRIERQQPDIVICGLGHVISFHDSISKNDILYNRISRHDKRYIDLVPMTVDEAMHYAAKDSHA
jgi:hypothetical protein